MGFVLALISSAAFGLIPLFSLPLLHSGLSADCVLFYRFLFASISLGLILVLRQERLAAPARDLGLLALFSVLYALAALLMIWGLLYLSGGVTATLQFLYPLMVMLIMTIFFHEKFSIITASSVLLAIITAVISNLTLILAIQRIGSTLASILGVGEPLTAVTVGILVFDEPATFAVFSGVAVICAAVVLVMTGPQIQAWLQKRKHGE